MRKVIFYGVNGEGLGHASRTLSVIEHLPECEIHVFTYGKAYDFFERAGHQHLHRIEGASFTYKSGKVDYLRSFFSFSRFWLKGHRRNTILIKELCKNCHPDLFISDFEPSVPRAAKWYRRPLLSIDNQHRFAYHDMVDLPWWLRAYGWGCGLFAKMLVPWPDRKIISTFHYDKIKPRGRNVVLTNGFLRMDVEATRPTDEGFLLVYMRPSVCYDFLRCLQSLEMPIKVYGAHGGLAGSSDGAFPPNIEFTALSSESFMRDLARCRAILSTAGNQLITEARYYKKPYLMIPEPGQYEQYINGIYAERLGVGRTYYIHELGSDMIKDWFYHGTSRTVDVENGVHKAVSIIKEHL